MRDCSNCITAVQSGVQDVLQHSPGVLHVRLGDDVQRVAELAERVDRKRLGKDVGDHVVGLEVVENDGAGLDEFAHKVMLDINVLGARVVDRGVASEGDAALVVLVDGRGAVLREAEFEEEGAEPDGFLGGEGERHVLGFRGGESDGGLALGLPRDGGVAEAEDVAGGGFAFDEVAAPVGVGVAGEERKVAVGAGGLEVELEVDRALDVAEDALGGLHVGFGRVGGEAADDVDGVGDVGTSADHQMHERADELLVDRLVGGHELFVVLGAAVELEGGLRVSGNCIVANCIVALQFGRVRRDCLP